MNIVAHTLNLSVIEGLKANKELSAVLKECRALVSHFKHSVQACNKLKEVQQQLNAPIIKVKQDVPTRWNSCFIMKDRLIQLKDLLSITVTNLSSNIPTSGVF